MPSMWRSRWAAVGAAVAVTLGAGGLGIVQATTSSGEKPIYQPINPCRLADIRPARDTVGDRTSPLGPEETYTLSGWGEVGNCTLPTGTAGLALNVTAVAPSQATYLTLFPAGASLPLTSNLNPTPGQPPTPNAVNVDLSPSGSFSVFNKYGTVYVIVDVVGYYDDHNHDDRYYQKTQTYTKSEVDTALGAKANTADVYTKDVTTQSMFAVVDADASLINATAGVTSEKYATVSTGRYVVRFPRAITDCALIAQNNQNNANLATALVYENYETPDDPNDAFVYFEDESDTARDRPFSLIVLC